MIDFSKPLMTGATLKQFKGYVRLINPNGCAVDLSGYMQRNEANYRSIAVKGSKCYLLCSFTNNAILTTLKALRGIYNLSDEACRDISTDWKMLTHNVDAAASYAIYAIPANPQALNEAIVTVKNAHRTIVCPIDLYDEFAGSGFGINRKPLYQTDGIVFLAINNTEARFMTKLEASVMLDRTHTQKIDNYLIPAMQANAAQDNLESIKQKAQRCILSPDVFLLEFLRTRFVTMAFDQHPEVSFSVGRRGVLKVVEHGKIQEFTGFVTQASTLQDFRDKTANLFGSSGNTAKYIFSHCSVYSLGSKVIFQIRQALLADNAKAVNDWLNCVANPDVVPFTNIKVERSTYSELKEALLGNVDLYASLCGYISGSIANSVEIGSVAYSKEGTVLSSDSSLSTRGTASQSNLSIAPITKYEFDSLHKYTTSSGGINRICRGQDALILKPKDKSICDVTTAVNENFEIVGSNRDLEPKRAEEILEGTAPNLWLETNYENIAHIDAVMNRAKVISSFLVFRGFSFNPRSNTRGSLLCKNKVGNIVALGTKPTSNDTNQMAILRNFDLDSNRLPLPAGIQEQYPDKTGSELLLEKILPDGTYVLANTGYASTSLSWQSTLMFAAKQDLDKEGKYEHPHFMGVVLAIKLPVGTKGIWLHNIASWDQQFEVLLDRCYDTRFTEYLFTLELPQNFPGKEAGAYRKVMVYSAVLVPHGSGASIPENAFQSNNGITAYDNFGRVPLRYTPVQAGVYAVARYLREKGISGATMWSWAYKDTHRKTEEGANIFAAPTQAEKENAQRVNAPLCRLIDNNLLHFVGRTIEGGKVVDYGFELISDDTSPVCDLYLRKIVGEDNIIRSYWTSKSDAGKRYLYNIHDFDPKVIADNPEIYGAINIDQRCSIPIGVDETLPDGFELSADISHITIPRAALQNAPKDIAECILMLLGKLDDASTMPLQTIGRYMDMLIQTYLSELAVYQSANARVVAHYSTCPAVVVGGVIEPDLRNLGNDRAANQIPVEALTLRYQISKIDDNTGIYVNIHIARKPNGSNIWVLCVLENTPDQLFIDAIEQGTTQELNLAVQDVVKFLRSKACIDSFSTTYAVVCNIMTHYLALKETLRRYTQQGWLITTYSIQGNAFDRPILTHSIKLNWQIKQVTDIGTNTKLVVRCTAFIELFTVPVDADTGAFMWENTCYSAEGEQIDGSNLTLAPIIGKILTQRLNLNITQDVLDQGYEGVRSLLRNAIAKNMPLLLTARRIVEKQMGIGVNEDIMKTVDI